MKILIVVLCLVVMPATLTGCSDYICRRKAKELCTPSFELDKICYAKQIERCNCLGNAKTEHEKKICDDVSKEFSY